MLLDTVVVGSLQVNCYILGSESTHRAVVIDPGDNAPAILNTLRRRGLQAAQIVATHGHFDHVLAVRALQEATGAPFAIHPAERSLLAAMRDTARAWLGKDPGEPPEAEGELEAAQVLCVDDIRLTVRATPGHSPGSVSFVDETGRRVFTGDALFAGSVGRTDLPGGDAKVLLNSIRSQIISLPADYTVLPGHGPASTVGHEVHTNPFLDPAAFDAWL